MFLHYFPWLVAALCLAGFLANFPEMTDEKVRHMAREIAASILGQLPQSAVSQLSTLLGESLRREMMTAARLEPNEARERLNTHFCDLTRQTTKQYGLELSGILDQLAPAKHPELREFLYNHASEWTKGCAFGREGTFLPASGVKYIVCHNGVTVLVLEEPARIRTVRYHHKRTTEKATHYRLSMPRLVYVLTFVANGLDEVHLVAAKKELESTTDMLYLLPLSNIHHDGEVCLGDLKSKMRNKPPVTVASCIIEAIWACYFNGDLPPKERIADPRLATLEDWRKATRADPSFIHDCKLMEHRTLGDHVATTYDRAYRLLGKTPDYKFAKATSLKSLSLLRRIWNKTRTYAAQLGTRDYEGTIEYETALLLEQAVSEVLDKSVARSTSEIDLMLPQALEDAIVQTLSAFFSANGGEQHE